MLLNCKDIAEEANNLIDGDLPFSKRLKLKLHIFMCSCCREYMHQMKNTVGAFKSIKPQEKSAIETESLLRLLQKEHLNSSKHNE